jgi:predicted signal transduction protein with EAL and GGDEF domain
MVDDIKNLTGDALFQLPVANAILAAQYGTRQVAVLLLDFDHAEGLGNIAQQFSEEIWTRLRNTLRDTDTVVRLDHGEFGVLLPAVNGAEDAILVANKIHTGLAEPLQSENIRLTVKDHIGIALYPEHGSNATMLIQQARVALTDALRINKGHVLFSHDAKLRRHAPLRMSRLRQAIIGDELFLVYQPKVVMRDGSVSGVEVLCRWQHPDLGVVLPDDFIPIAERTGLIVPLTLWVLHRSLMQCREWNESGIDLGVAVNISMRNLDALELPRQIAGLLESVGVPPERLELEITESTIMSDAPRAIRNLTLIRELGVALTIDDFGTGYSSLAYLTKLPVRGIKIDKSFVQNMESDRDNAVIVRTIVDLGHNLGLKVVAEGAETRKTVEMLQSFKCNEVQGYYFCPPVVGHRIREFFADRPVALGQSIPQAWDVSKNDLVHLSLTTPFPKLVNAQDHRYELPAEIADGGETNLALKVR